LKTKNKILRENAFGTREEDERIAGFDAGTSANPQSPNVERSCLARRFVLANYTLSQNVILMSMIFLCAICFIVMLTLRFE
jgi:hypothetical protein